jgi:hypothetical protein
MDPTSLAIDERFRSEDSYRATNPLNSMIFAFPAMGLMNGPAPFILVWGLGGLTVLLLWSWGLQSRPWQALGLNTLTPGFPVPVTTPR